MYLVTQTSLADLLDLKLLVQSRSISTHCAFYKELPFYESLYILKICHPHKHMNLSVEPCMIIKLHFILSMDCLFDDCILRTKTCGHAFTRKGTLLKIIFPKRNSNFTLP